MLVGGCVVSEMGSVDLRRMSASITRTTTSRDSDCAQTQSQRINKAGYMLHWKSFCLGDIVS